ncbi:MAG: polyphosphate polymerase domain-containing protein [Lachnospiraceae bacterium]|nr:polyphosphate polymerase domain-containing protein [Lachnospiraceae bacterium]
MKTQMTFARVEIKYLLTRQQRDRILEGMREYMKPDDFGKTSIRNIYYDTENYRLVRHSIEKPPYKEKLRVRSYGSLSDPSEKVFVELKKKYDGIVYKRRLSGRLDEVTDWLAGRADRLPDTQIAREIEYFRDHYETLQPAVYLSYDRQAYYGKDNRDLRITFDENILARTDRTVLLYEPYGTPLIRRDQALMEIKADGGYPMWLVKILSQAGAEKVSFSKYGTAYQMLILGNEEGGRRYA